MKPLIRQIIYPKDVQIYTGKSRFTAYRMIVRIKRKLNKSKDEMLTVTEFCIAMKIDEEEMMEIIKARS